jgi:hypothetical protein
MKTPLCLLAFSAALNSLPLQAAVIANWSMDDLNSALLDSTGNHPVGTVVGSVVQGQPGVPNGTYGAITVTGAAGLSTYFGPNASDSYFTIGDSNANPVMNIGRTGSMTVMSWIAPLAPDVAGRAYRPVSTGSFLGTDRGWGFALRFGDTIGANTTVRLTTYGVADNDSTPFAVNFGEWIHIAATYSNGAINYYLNGNQLGSSDTSLFGDELSAARLTVGGRTGGNDFDQTNGFLDGIRVYDEVLSTEAIRAAAVASVVPEPSIGLLVGIAGLALLSFRRR